MTSTNCDVGSRRYKYLLQSWLDYFAEHAPKHMGQLRRLTLAGPDTSRCGSIYDLQSLKERVPKLKGIGFQLQGSIAVVDTNFWKEWNFTQWLRTFGSSVHMAFEQIKWQNANAVEQQIAVRVLRQGSPTTTRFVNGLAPEWSDDDVEVEKDEPDKLVAHRSTAKWRQWWRG